MSNQGNVVSELLADALRETLENNITLEEKGWIQRIESLRAQLNSSTAEIGITHYPAGQGGGVSKTIGEVAQTTSKRHLWSLFLFKLVRKFSPSTCLELGTSLGISAAYQAAGLKLNHKGVIVTLEGAESVATLATENFKELELNNVVTVVGRFQDTLDSVLDKYRPINFAFIDGHHQEQATLTYFERIYPSLSERAVLVFDDISWSEGMKRAWSTIEADPRIELSVDLHLVGICSLKGNIERKQNLNLRKVGRFLHEASKRSSQNHEVYGLTDR